MRSSCGLLYTRCGAKLECDHCKSELGRTEKRAGKSCTDLMSASLLSYRQFERQRRDCDPRYITSFAAAAAHLSSRQPALTPDCAQEIWLLDPLPGCPRMGCMLEPHTRLRWLHRIRCACQALPLGPQGTEARMLTSSPPLEPTACMLMGDPAM